MLGALSRLQVQRVPKTSYLHPILSFGATSIFLQLYLKPCVQSFSRFFSTCSSVTLTSSSPSRGSFPRVLPPLSHPAVRLEVLFHVFFCHSHVQQSVSRFFSTCSSVTLMSTVLLEVLFHVFFCHSHVHSPSQGSFPCVLLPLSCPAVRLEVLFHVFLRHSHVQQSISRFFSTCSSVTLMSTVLLEVLFHVFFCHSHVQQSISRFFSMCSSATLMSSSPSRGSFPRVLPSLSSSVASLLQQCCHHFSLAHVQVSFYFPLLRQSSPGSINIFSIN